MAGLSCCDSVCVCVTSQITAVLLFSDSCPLICFDCLTSLHAFLRVRSDIMCSTGIVLCLQNLSQMFPLYFCSLLHRNHIYPPACVNCGCVPLCFLHASVFTEGMSWITLAFSTKYLLSFSSKIPCLFLSSSMV